MRRIYESGALHRDDDDPFSPGEADETRTHQAFRSVPGTALSRLLVPHWLRDRAISIEVSTPRAEFAVGTPVPFRVTMRNALPFPITITTRSPVLWTWEVDGLTEASSVQPWDPPDEPRAFTFDRGERKRFTRRWNGMFRVTESEWEPASPGEYTIGVGVNVEEPADRGLYGETNVRLVPTSE